MNEKSDRAKREEEVLEFWKDNKIFEKSLEKKAPKGEFVFYDGPPFATGLPHHGSLLSSIIKDVIPRYKTMRGYHVRRRWGWDCHGLPIENMVEKELGLKDKTEIEGKVGIKAFNQACRDSVLRYDREWKKYVERIGRWVDYDNAYKTMDNSFIESVWHALKEINNKGLLYEGRKVLLYCPHCQTPIAKAEIAMDNSYKDVTEESVFIKFKIKGENKFLLAWTTTPWTLPGNVALAVREDIEYVEVTNNLILAKDRLEILGEGYEIVRETKGSELVGLEYEPLYKITDDPNAYRVYAADFVNTEDGTGIVHTAVLYGEEDFNLGLRENLPQVPLLDEAAHFNKSAPEFIQGQYFKKAERAIKEDLENRGLLFKKEMHTHSYPHCWRCGTALLYNALTSWFINIQKVKQRMIALNEKVNWVPEHLKHGRFLNIVENAPDWTISRNRYWASPLPIWKDESGKVYVIGSLEELKKYTKKSGNKYFVMRHGEAIYNAKGVEDRTGASDNHLTDKGRKQVEITKDNLGDIDIVVSSPFLRTQETAKLISSEFITDDRLREIGPDEDEREVKKRMFECIFDIENKYRGKKILIVSHQTPLHELTQNLLDTGEHAQFDFVPFPHNDNFELDLHRPYIDEIELVTEDGKRLTRIPEVIDGWVESGSMPFAEYHYPFENKQEFEKRFPGDFIAEYIAQTRTWFYYMHAMAVLLFDNISFKNVVSTGTVLAGDGAKISKSKGNYTDPLALLDQFGADSFRYYLMSSVVMQAEDMLFKDAELKDIHNRLVNILANSFTFYELHADASVVASDKSDNVLDKWIIARLRELIESVTEAMDTYDLVKATRPVRDFVTDLSTWYIRRSRDRLKGEDEEDKRMALATTRYVFKEFSKLIAPVMPFIAEDIYQKVKGDDEPESVHLCEWPQVKKSFFSTGRVIEDTAEVRRLVSLALDERQKAGIKVRQPLQKLEVKKLAVGKDYVELIKDEVNVKEVVENQDLETEVRLDTAITPELEEEGRVRDEIRLIQDLRKERNLKPGEKMDYEVPAEKKELFAKYGEEIAKSTNIVLPHLHD